MMTSMQLVNPSGPPSDIMVVSDYPTKNEYAVGESFKGPTGNLLQNLISPYGLKISSLFKSHYYKIPISGYSSPSKKIQKESLEKVKAMDKWDWYIKEELEAVQPNVILAMGELSLQALTEEKGIKKWRGSILHLHPRFGSPNIKVVPTHSPREIWEQNEAPIVYCQWDIGRIVKVRDLKARYRPNETIWIVEHPNQLANWWDRAKLASFITLDIETHHGFVTCIGFSHNGTEAISIPLLVGNKMDYDTRGRLYEITNRILRSGIPKVNQNIKYDWSVLENFGFDIKNIIGDTMLMAHTLYPELPVGLDFLNSIYTDIPYYKDEGKKFDPKIHDISRLLKYNARDALVTWQIWEQQQEDAKAFGVKDFYFKNVHPAFFIYKKMDQLGIRVDDTQRKKLLDKYTPMLCEHQQTINLIAEETINVLSPTQVGRFVYEIMKCPKQTHVTPTGNIAYNTDEESLEELYVNKISDQGRKALLKSIIVAKKLSKVIQFLTSPISPDGRMRTSYKLQGTETGRTSAGKSLEPHFYIEGTKIKEAECGGSFQTIPKHGYEFGKLRIGDDLRSIFRPSHGYTFVEGDQGQAEDRVVCVLATDWEGLELLNKTTFIRNKHGLKDDRHTLTACLVTGKKFEDITPDDRQERGKKPRHAGNYNMGPYMLMVFTHLGFKECNEILYKFHSTNPKIRGVFHTEVRDIVLKKRFLVSPQGRRRDLFGRIDEKSFKEYYATIPQATVSDFNKFVLLRKLDEKYKAPLAFPIAESHDSLTWEVRSDLVEEFSDYWISLPKANPIDFNGCSLSRDYQLVIPIEIHSSSENWGECK